MHFMYKGTHKQIERVPYGLIAVFIPAPRPILDYSKYAIRLLFLWRSQIWKLHIKNNISDFVVKILRITFWGDYCRVYIPGGALHATQSL